MDIQELKQKKQLLESKIDTLIATFLEENKGIDITNVEVEIIDVRDMVSRVVSKCVNTKITLSL